MWAAASFPRVALSHIATPVVRPSVTHRVLSALTQRHSFASKAKHKKTQKAVQEEEEEPDYFEIDEYLDKLKEIEHATLSAIEELRPVAMSLEDLEIIEIMGKDLPDVCQIVMKSPIVVHLHVFDVKNKSKVVRELTLLRDDWTVQSDEGDLIIVRMPNPKSAQVLQKVTARANKIQEKHHQQMQQVISKAASKIKQVNIGNNWHKKQHELLNNANKMASDRLKAAIKKLNS